MIIDTDPGVDDAFAIALAATSPAIDLLAVSAVYGNVTLAGTTANALRVLAATGRADVPVLVGAERPLVHPQPHRASHVHGADGLSGRAGTLPEPGRAAEPGDGVARLAALLHATERPVTLAAIGPLTNVALLLAAHPSVRPKIDRLVVMGGGLDGGNVTAAAEFNVWSDPEAAHRVLAEEDVPTVLVPLDLTHRCAVDAGWLDRLAESGPLGAALVGLTPSYRENYRRMLGIDGMVLHDAVALAEAVRPGILRTEPMPLSVECSFGPGRGAVLPDRRPARVREAAGRTGRPVDVAVDVDLAVLREFLLDRLATARPSGAVSPAGNR
ncbi:purine nucleosidase [Gandjariella thermophila]|uniref:Purine nucleosidase n=1 Tax=Gandjariella thermophila TaxID=1931992 RepID=A0A4D4JA59_9PSEU|nr:purine nucleosidase [Gandjariella thermophila]